MLYIFFTEYNKLYTSLIGQENKWYQKLFIVPLSILSFSGKRYLKKHSEYGEKKNYVAVIIANNYFPENVHNFSLMAIKNLVKYLNKNKKNYRVYNKVTSNKLKEILKGKEAKSIFIFGHGERHGIRVGKNEVMYYCDVPKSPKKHLIAQFHCNHYSGKSFSDYNKPKFSFVTNSTQRLPGIEKQIKEIIKRKLI